MTAEQAKDISVENKRHSSKAVRGFVAVAEKDAERVVGKELASEEAMLANVEKLGGGVFADYDGAGNTPTVSGSNVGFLPPQARLQYGCMNCEFKKLRICPFCKGLKPRAAERFVHKNKICQERLNHLMSFSRGYQRVPTFSQWQRDYTQARAMLRERYDDGKLRKMEYDLEEMEEKRSKGRANLQKVLDGGVMPSDGSDEDIDVVRWTELIDSSWARGEDKQRLREENMQTDEFRYLEFKAEVMQQRQLWHGIWRDVMGYEERQVDRETPKKVEMEHTRGDISPLDLHNLMKKANAEDAVEAEFKEVDEGKDEVDEDV